MKLFRPDEAEYNAARNGTIFARLHRGVIRGTGNDRLDLIHRLSTGEVGKLGPGEEGTTVLTSEKGRVLEVLRVLQFENHSLMLLQGTKVEEVIAWLDKYTIMDDFATGDVTAEYVLIGVYGEHAKPLLERILESPMPDTGRFARTERFGGTLTILREVRLNGAGSFLVIASRDAAPELVRELTDAGCAEIGEATRQALRIAVGQPEMDAELTGEYNPLEAGLVSYVSFTKGCYIGQEVIARLDAYDKVKRRLIGIRLEGTLDEIPAEDGAEVTVREPVEDASIGTVTSLTWSFEFNAPIGLCYIRSAHASPGLPVILANGQGTAVARGTLEKLPF